jgi:hypothetical protein
MPSSSLSCDRLIGVNCQQPSSSGGVVLSFMLFCFVCRKPVWHQLSLLGLQDLTNSCCSPITPAAVLSQRSLAVARLRLQMRFQQRSSGAIGKQLTCLCVFYLFAGSLCGTSCHC